MRIDSHQHFWKYDQARYPWIDDDVLRRNFLPQDLHPLLKSAGLDGSIAVQAEMSEAETGFLLRLAEENAFIKGIVGWVDLLDKKVDERLEVYNDSPLIKGFRHIVQDEPDDEFMLRPDFQRGIGCLEKYGFTYDILVYPRQLPAAIGLARQFPNQLFVLDHIAKPDISNGLHPLWIGQMQELASLPNVYCKLSGMVTETREFKWEPKDFTPFLDVAFNAFGPERLMFGSDWPVCLLAGSYTEVNGIVSSYLDTYPAIVKNKVMGTNAVKFYRL
jgi:L-fuconolactonase